MTNSNEIQALARAENNQKLWAVLEVYKNDSDGLTRSQLTELAEFNLAEGTTPYEIFTRAIKVCRRRAKKADMFIPRATRGSGGYAYVLTDRATLAVDGFLAAERVAQGVQRAAYDHQGFIERDLASLSPVERVAFERVVQISNQRKADREQHLQDELDLLESLRNAAAEEREGWQTVSNN